ncbi:MAG: TonB-dependent receptor, partial [Sphingomonadales bacterium]|nr:TonB-dependent receptor [Sphingomonadales bacterium]
VPQNAETFDGNPLPFASKYSATLSAKYQWAPRHNIQASIAANAKNQSAFYLDAEGLEARKQDGYSIIDATAKLDFDTGMSVKLWGRNLGNSAYAVSGFGFIGYNTFLGAPRTYGISVAYTY